MYQTLNEGSGIHWPTVAHMGLLKIDLGFTEEAFKLWDTTLDRSSQGNDAARAAGYILITYSSLRNWNALEVFSKKCLARSIVARDDTKRLDVRDYLSSALFNGGKEDFERQNFANAIRRFDEFTKGFSTDRRMPEAMFLLANSYKGGNRHPEAQSTILELVKRYPSSPFYQRALLQGVQWSIEMADEQNAISLAMIFVNAFPRSSEFDSVQTNLLNLLIGREFYAEAAQIYRRQIASRSPRAVEAANALLTLEEKYGSPQGVLNAADQLLKTVRNDPDSRARAWGAMARVFVIQNKMPEVVRMERLLSGLNSSSEVVRENLGEVRFHIARQRAVALDREEFYNLELRDPTRTINDGFRRFGEVKTAFDRVCEAGGSFCVRAVFSVARSAETLLDKFQDIEMPSTYDPAVVSVFTARKEQIMNSLSDVAMQYDERSVAQVANNLSMPEWTNQILWQNSVDWNFDKVSGETGNGYIQISVPVHTSFRGR
jgi:TolA-binding protein